MPKVQYTNAKGMHQVTGTGFLPLGAADDTVLGLGAQRQQVFTYSLSGIDGSSPNFADGDALIELGTLNVEAMSGLTPTQIVITRVVANVTEAAGTTLAANLRLSAVSGTAANAALTGGVEVAGASATFQSGDTAADINLNSATCQASNPLASAAIAKTQLYLCTTTALAATLAAGTGNILVEYFVI